MPNFRPKKVVASVGGLYSKSQNNNSVTPGSSLVIVSDTEPTTRDDGTALQQGDFWWHPAEEEFSLYLDTGWQRVGGSLNTESLALTNPTTFVAPSTLPDATGLSTQKDYNEWLFSAFESLDERLTEVEPDDVDVNLSELTYEGHSDTNEDNPIYVTQKKNSVTHYFRMDELKLLADINFFDGQRRGRLRRRMRSLIKTTDAGDVFEPIAPMTVEVNGKNVLHSLLISACSSVTDTTSHRVRGNNTLNNNANDDEFIFNATPPVTVDVQDPIVALGLQISGLTALQ